MTKNELNDILPNKQKKDIKNSQISCVSNFTNDFKSFNSKEEKPGLENENKNYKNDLADGEKNLTKLIRKKLDQNEDNSINNSINNSNSNSNSNSNIDNYIIESNGSNGSNDVIKSNSGSTRSNETEEDRTPLKSDIKGLKTREDGKEIAYNSNIELFDYIIIGTGLAETAISYLLSKDKNCKILHLDSNSSYGSDFCTYQYSQLLDHFRKKEIVSDLKENSRGLISIVKSKEEQIMSPGQCLNSVDLKKIYSNPDAIASCHTVSDKKEVFNLGDIASLSIKSNKDSSGITNLNCFNSKDPLKDMSNYFYVSNYDDKAFLSKNIEFNIDLTPKLLLQDSEMRDFLVNHEIHEMVNFTAIKGSYLYSKKLHRIPTTEAQSLKSSAISFSQKFKVMNFFWNLRSIFREFENDRADINREYDKADTKTEYDNEDKISKNERNEENEDCLAEHDENENNESSLYKRTMLEEFKSFGLTQDSMDFIGHAIALNLNDDYLHMNPKYTYKNIVRYISSLISFEGADSPYIYPLYGLSELSQAFSRKSAINGTTFMLNAKIEFVHELGHSTSGKEEENYHMSLEEANGELSYSNKNVKEENKKRIDKDKRNIHEFSTEINKKLSLSDHVKDDSSNMPNKADSSGFYLKVRDPDGENHIFKGKYIITDPKYFPQSKIVKHVIRCIMILKKEDLDSRNVIFLRNSLTNAGGIQRKNDIFCVFLNKDQCVCPDGYEIGIISTIKETDDPHSEIKPIVDKFKYLKYFVEVRNIYSSDNVDNVIFTKSIDESAVLNNIYDDIQSVMRILKH